MSSIHFTSFPAPEILKNDIECVRITEYSGEEAVAIKVFPTGVPGMVFHHHNGQPALEQIITATGRTSSPPPLFLYGPGIEPSVMQYASGPSTTMQVIFKPHALKTLLGLNAAHLSSGWADMHALSGGELDAQLIEAKHDQDRLHRLLSFLITMAKHDYKRDALIEESLRVIHQNIGSLHIKDLLNTLNISERQFERRFTQTVGLSPHVYMRVKRFQEAIRLMKAGQFARLTDIAGALNFADQSHFIRDIKAFSATTPKSLSQHVDDLYADQAGYASL